MACPHAVVPPAASASVAQTPMPPQNTIAPLAVAVILCLLLLGLSYHAGLSVARYLFPDSNPHRWAVLFFVLTLILSACSVKQAMSYHKQSRKQWHGQDFTTARRTAAKSRGAALSSMGISLFFVPLLTLLIFVTVNHGAVAETFLRWHVIVESFTDVTKAAWINVKIALAAEILSLVLGLVLAVGRSLSGQHFAPVRLLCITYIDIFRCLPAIVVVYLICFGLPLTETSFIGDAGSVTYAIIALTLTFAAYQAEIFRAGIESIHVSQIAAAQSLGLSQYATFRYVVLPQALRRMAPPLLSIFVALQKDTALVNIVGIIDTFAQAKIYAANLYNLSAITVVCILFISVTIPQTRFVDYLIAKGKQKNA